MPAMNSDMLRRFAPLLTSGGSREDAFAIFLQVLKESGVSQSAIDEAQAIGPKLLKKQTLPRSIKALTGGLESSQTADQVFNVARTTAQGIPDHIITTEWGRAIQKLGGENTTLATRLKTVPKDVVVRAVRSGGFTGGPSTPVGGALTETGGGALATIPKVAGTAAEAGAEATAAGVVKKGLGSLAKGGIVGGLLSTLMPWGSASPLTLPFRAGRARDKAIMGFQAMGATSSGDVLSSIVNQQALASRRQMVLQNFEPELFQRMLTALATNELPAAAITPTERKIGGMEGMQDTTLPARRPDKDVKFLLDQLMQEMSGPL